ncbi:MAG: nucleotidyltransferase substrate binding protein [Candidatus Edwardsbacteria bacterium]
MKEVLKNKLNNFSNALKKLEEALKESGYSLSLDGTIKRFEFTFEMSWKALKKFLLYEGTECTSARDCIKKAYQLDFIKEENLWLDMLNDRNISAHIYDEKEAEKIYQKIKEAYVGEFRKLEETLIKKLETD